MGAANDEEIAITAARTYSRFAFRAETSNLLRTCALGDYAATANRICKYNEDDMCTPACGVTRPCVLLEEDGSRWWCMMLYGNYLEASDPAVRAWAHRDMLIVSLRC